MADESKTEAPAAPAAPAPAPAATAAAPAAPAAPAEQTMIIEMLCSLEGGVSLIRGDLYECAQSEALRHIEAGHAIPFADKPKEKATKKAAAETR